MVNTHFSEYSGWYYYYYGISSVDEFVESIGKDVLILNFEKEMVMDKLAEMIPVE